MDNKIKQGIDAIAPLATPADAGAGLTKLTRYHYNEHSQNMHDDPCGEFYKVEDVRAHLARLSTPAAPVTAEPVAHLFEWIGGSNSGRKKGAIIARSVEELRGNIDMYPHVWKRLDALYAAPVSPQPAAQVPSIDRDSVRTAALEEAADAIRTVLWQIENGDGLCNEVYGAERCRDAIGELIKGQPAAAHAAKEGGQQ